MSQPKIVGTAPCAYIDAGIGHFIPIEKVLIVFTAEGREAERIRKGFRQRGMTLDFTGGAKTKSMLMLVPGGYLILSPRSTATITRAMQEWYFDKQFGPKGTR
jgi:regulator of extracellular matrix RemA (YlzA/DUF370 family)